jgi:undecaprenyl-diphosphatase
VLVLTLTGFALVLGLAIGIGLLLGLAERPDGSTGVDSSITSWMIAHRTNALTSLARALSRLGSQVVLVPVTAVAAAALVVRRKVALAGLLVAGWGGATLLYTVTKPVVDRHRPPEAIWLTNVGKTPSFPSGHATQSLATFVALVFVAAVWLPRARWLGRALAVVLAAGVGWSRVYLGVHWATDVGGGWLIATVWIVIVIRLYGRHDQWGACGETSVTPNG